MISATCKYSRTTCKDFSKVEYGRNGKKRSLECLWGLPFSTYQLKALLGVRRLLLDIIWTLIIPFIEIQYFLIDLVQKNY